MSAVVVAFLLAVAAGRLMSLFGFAIAWLAGLVLYALFFAPVDATAGQHLVSLFALSGVAQVGFFAGLVLQVSTARSGRVAIEVASRTSLGKLSR
jgi:hypothetical protein